MRSNVIWCEVYTYRLRCWSNACNFPRSSLSPLHFTYTFSSIDNLIKSKGTSTLLILYSCFTNFLLSLLCKQYHRQTLSDQTLPDQTLHLVSLAPDSCHVFLSFFLLLTRHRPALHFPSQQSPLVSLGKIYGLWTTPISHFFVSCYSVMVSTIIEVSKII